jgi:heme/copper-type cytochrome/quinol oxidase subunit 2
MHGRRQIFFLGMAVLGAMILFAPLPARLTPPTQRLVRVQAGQYAYAPGEIRVNQGDVVTIELTSSDVVHGLYLDEYGLSVTADPGQTSRLTFTADRPGMFRFRCSVTCGAMHPFMIGKLAVGNNDWLARTAGLIVLAGLGATYFPRKVQA